MSNRTMLKTGLIGATITAVCCVTPILLILFGAVGLSALTGYLDYVLFPALAMFLAIIFYALWKKQTA